MRKVLWLLLLFPGIGLATEASPDAVASRLWQVLSHEPGQAVDTAALGALFHPSAVIFGSREREGRAALDARPAAQFVAAQAPIDADGFHECEIERKVVQEDRFATIYSVVESRSDPEDAKPNVVGVNSLQLYRTDAGWQILSLYYHLRRDDAAPAGSARKACLGS
jgi:hypothetical protein